MDVLTSAGDLRIPVNAKGERRPIGHSLTEWRGPAEKVNFIFPESVIDILPDALYC